MAILSCAVCQCEFSPKSPRAKYCSRKCTDRGKPSANWQGRVNAPAGLHGVSGYRRGCRCDTCRLGQNAAMREYSASRKARDGIGLTARWRRNFKAKHGYWPQQGGGEWIPPKTRQLIYDRDGLACYICGDVLDRLAEINDPKAPTIDHFIPRSKGGSDDLDNLKTCCRDCNVRKSDSMPAEAILIA